MWSEEGKKRCFRHPNANIIAPLFLGRHNALYCFITFIHLLLAGEHCIGVMEMSETELVCLDISGLAFHASRGHPNLPYSSPNQHTYSGTFTDLAISKPLESLLVVRPPGSSSLPRPPESRPLPRSLVVLRSPTGTGPVLLLSEKFDDTRSLPSF